MLDQRELEEIKTMLLSDDWPTKQIARDILIEASYRQPRTELIRLLDDCIIERSYEEDNLEISTLKWHDEVDFLIKLEYDIRYVRQ